jgi:hypothetical protein
MLAQHLHDAALRRQPFIVGRLFTHPLPGRCFEHGVKTIGHGFVWTEETEVASLGVEGYDVPQEAADHACVLGVCGAGPSNTHAVGSEIRHHQIAQQLSPVGVGIRPHASRPGWRERCDLWSETALVVEQLPGAIAAHPGLEQSKVLGIRARRGQGNLVGAKRPFDPVPVHDCRPGPALRGRENDHRPLRARPYAARACAALDVPDGVHDDVEGACHPGMHLRWIVALDEMRIPPVAAQQLRELAPWDACEHRRVRNLVAVQVQDRQHRAVGGRIEEHVRVPGSSERTGLGFAIADHACRDQVGVVEHGAEGVTQRVAQLAALVDAAGRFRCDVAGDAAGERELPEERREPGPILRDRGIDLAVGPFQIHVGHDSWPAMPRARQINHVEVQCRDHPIEVCVDEVLARRRAPVSEQPWFDVRRLQWFRQQGIVEQIDLTDRQVVRGTPVGVQKAQGFGQ